MNDIILSHQFHWCTEHLAKIELDSSPNRFSNYDLSENDISMAMKQANWAWTDIIVAFSEIGVDPSQNEKERIMKKLFVKKIKGVLWKKNKY